MHMIRFFGVEKCHFPSCKTWAHCQRAEMSIISSDGFTLIRQELLVENNIFTVYYCYSEGIIVIGYNGNFIPRINGCLVYRFKD